MASPLGFVTFGMFIIDEIEYLNDKKPQQNLIGGAGVYAALGARLCAGRSNSKAVSWIVDMGSDFPEEFKIAIDSWVTSCTFRIDQGRLTTRAWNGYGANEHRDFRYLTAKKRLEVASLSDEQACGSSFHMVCSPTRCMDLTSRLQERRQLLGKDLAIPLIIWEPIPDLCTPEELQNLQRAASGVSVVSPNADELASFFGQQHSRLSQDDMVDTFMGWASDEVGDDSRTPATKFTHVIIREGANGSSVYVAPGLLARSRGLKSEDAVVGQAGQPNTSVRRTGSGPGSRTQRRRLKVHLPAYHTKSQASKVVDPTGGGNTYLGALALSMTKVVDGTKVSELITRFLPPLSQPNESSDHSDDFDADGHQSSSSSRKAKCEMRKLVTAAIYAVIAASYAIEQSGVATLTSVPATRPTQEPNHESNSSPSSSSPSAHSSEQAVSSNKVMEDADFDTTTATTTTIIIAGTSMIINNKGDDDDNNRNEKTQDEQWNYESFTHRTQLYLEREHEYIHAQLRSKNFFEPE